MSLSSANAVSFLSLTYLISMILIPVIGNVYLFSSPHLKHGDNVSNNSDIDNQETWIDKTNIWLLLSVSENIIYIIGGFFLFLVANY